MLTRNFIGMNKYFVWLGIFLSLTVLCSSCKKEFPDDPLSVSDYSVSTCKGRIELKKGEIPEYITLKTVNSYYLKFTHVNSMFNCSPGEITVSLSYSPGSVVIDENESQAGERCICPYDLQFILGPLEYGTYKIEFQKAGVTFKEYSLDFSRTTDVRIDLN